MFNRFSRLTRISMLLAFFFALDKGVAILRQLIIARQFGLSAELDAFNVANNLPDMLYAIISGGALALAFIPVLTEVLTKEGRSQAWDLFSRVANLVFLITAVFAVFTALFASRLVRMEIGIAPGFGPEQQELVTTLMRLNLIATMIFSISGLVMASLQANQHFLLPAMAPLMYNFGQIFGALMLSPESSYQLGPITIPAFGLGIHGLVYGVILGALLHLAIQIPALVRYGFRWAPRIGLTNPNVVKVLRLMGPRLVTVFFSQIIFLVRDNLASRLEQGAVSALTYGYMIQQVPETLIGTAIGTAILPTLAEHFARKDHAAFQETVDRAVRVLLATTIPIAAILSLALRPVLQFAFGFDDAGTNLLMNVTRGFLIGLIGHSLLELAARSFYSLQNAVLPMLASAVNVILYISLGTQLYRWLGPAGISLTDSIAYTVQAVLLLVLLSRVKSVQMSIGPTLLRALLGAGAASLTIFFILRVAAGRAELLVGLASLLAGGIVALPFIWKELRILVRL